MSHNGIFFCIASAVNQKKNLLCCPFVCLINWCRASRVTTRCANSYKFYFCCSFARVFSQYVGTPVAY